MARRKGKSDRRIKNWHQQYRHGQTDSPKARRQRLAPRSVKLPSHRLAAPEENLEDLPKVEGMVMGFFPGGAVVRVEGEPLLCGIAKTFRAPEGSSPLAVGDNVTVAATRPGHAEAAEADKDRADGMIIARRPRRTLLARPRGRSGRRRDAYDSGTFEKVIAANIDVLLIIAATRQPKLRPGLIDRYRIIAERGDLEPILVINKIDLARPSEQELADLSAQETEVFCCSAATGEGLDRLASVLAGKRSVLGGASGVGKSTLVNRLVPGADAATRSVRSKDSRGRHTTAGAVVYDLPAGGIIIDTPGIRELNVHLKATELPWYFPEFESFARRCRFNDCTHTHEPDCAVRSAAEAGEIPQRRYGSYLRILETLEQA